MLRIISLGLIFFFAVSICTYAQEAGDAPVSQEVEEDVELENLLSLALQLSSNSEWDAALKALDDAALINPEEPRIASYRHSFTELKALDEAQKTWLEGNTSEVKRESSSQEPPQEEEEPKFVIDHKTENTKIYLEQFRDQFRVELALKILTSDSNSQNLMGTWTSWEEFAYASLGLDIRYWFPFLKRILGINVTSSGYSWKVGNPSIIFNALDFGVNLRGFLAETPQARLEIGLDLGASLQTEFFPVENTHAYDVMAYLGAWISDPVFYHLFKWEKVKDLIFRGEIRIYSASGEEFDETLFYKVDGIWKFKNFYTGLGLEAWNFLETGTHRNTTSFTLFGGFYF